MSDNNYQEVIKNNKLFDGIPPQDLKFSFKNEQILRRKEGEIIFQKGDESRSTYLIIAGRVKIKVYIENKSVKLNKTINDFFGEIEVLEDTYRRSAAVANTDCILYILSKNDLRTFLAENPGINDNIIAYNKVEIPELQITINPGLLKEDTDKLYITTPPKNKAGDELSEISAPQEINELEDKRREIEKTAEMILEISGDEEDDFEDEELPEDEFPDDKSSKDEIPEEELPKVDLIDEKLPEEDFSDNEIREDEIDLSTTDELTAEEIGESENNPEIEPDDEIIQTESAPAKPSSYEDNLIEEEPDANPEATDEVAVKIQEEGFEENELNNHYSDQEDGTGWINLNPVESIDEIPDEVSDEEKFLYDLEDEKLKYDDTEINTERILEAIRKINSSFDKRSVYSNIVRESVKLTEAQAGILYRVDPLRNQLVTKIDTEDGMVEASYSISSGLTGLAAETGEIINVREPIKDFRFSEDVDSIRGIVGSSIMCVPLKNGNNDTIAVISLANSSSGKFSISDEEKISNLGTHISQALLCLDGIDSMLDENKNNYLSTLTRFITDNIQMPVLTMKYYASKIKKKDVPQDVRTVLSVLMDQADSVVNFLHSTLAFTENKNPLKIETCSLREVMDDALGLLAEYVESRNVGLYKKVESSLKVKLDKQAFYQACHQIAKNACDAMGENGNIYITAKQSGDLVNIEFRDTGPGIPEEYLSQIFQPFKSFKKKKGRD